MSEEKQPRKASSVRHTRAIQRDRTKHSITTPSDEQIQERLAEIVQPATLAQVDYFRKLGLRERTLGLIVMVAFVLDMVWRQISGVSEMVRVIQTETVLWVSPRKVSQQAFSQRLTSMPAELFLNILLSVLPRMQHRWSERTRPLPPEIAWAQARYCEVQAVDGSTLDALIRKIGLLKDLPQNRLAGKITALLNLGSRLPSQIWYESDPKAHDHARQHKRPPAWCQSAHDTSNSGNGHTRKAAEATPAPVSQRSPDICPGAHALKTQQR